MSEKGPAGNRPSRAMRGMRGNPGRRRGFRRLLDRARCGAGPHNATRTTAAYLKEGALTILSKLAEIRTFCRENADDAVVAKYTRFFTEGYDAYGVERKLMEKQRLAWFKAYSGDLDFEGFMDLGDRLARSGKYEEGSLAIFFAAAHRKQFTPGSLDRLGAWLDWGFRNWALTDSFCGEVLSHFITDAIIGPEGFSGWRNAESKWKRRAVPVALIRAPRVGIPVTRLLDFLTPMMPDKEKVVQQGLGWFLKEAWKHSPAPVEHFLAEWKDSCSRLIIRIACEKMSASGKAAFRKSRR